MKGVILAGGTGSRLFPLTKVTNKHLLPIYNKPMIYYPLQTLISANIKEVLIISGPEHAGHFLNLLGSGKEFGVKFTYEIQEKAGGIAQALSLAEDFSNNGPITVILGDNIYEDNFSEEIKSFEKGGMIFLKEVQDPERFGVAELNGKNVIKIEEKPKIPKSNYCVTGLYVYDNEVFSVIKTLKPSKRGELEITDVNNYYIDKNAMKAEFVKGFWSDAGTFESLIKASNLIREKIN
ncbi:MAG: Glucose-1-phosphate thymidylyltransferase [archaeon GW2011_AR13]|nr:MAG: Glucose-1-phosphate thymidylyltransferase [archaeon GW2011_AR13]HIG94195.1 NTP transferase domain-containing protein [Nanoarchaeota archaeon]HIH62695.1 NTP transferase domain-containing protein [Nanoarchaeota archaeon]HIJ09901.1 NTP transferase domain-containing protein [Nanoarchaeota archaeon]